MAWNCTGTKLASGSVDQTARVWHIEPHGHVKFLVFIICLLVDSAMLLFFLGGGGSEGGWGCFS